MLSADISWLVCSHTFILDFMARGLEPGTKRSMEQFCPDRG